MIRGPAQWHIVRVLSSSTRIGPLQCLAPNPLPCPGNPSRPHPCHLSPLPTCFVRPFQVDEEPSIRANTTVLLGTLATHLSEATCRKVLLNAFTRALRDGFPPARAAGLRVRRRWMGAVWNVGMRGEAVQRSRAGHVSLRMPYHSAALTHPLLRNPPRPSSPRPSSTRRRTRPPGSCPPLAPCASTPWPRRVEGEGEERHSSSRLFPHAATGGLTSARPFL